MHSFCSLHGMVTSTLLGNPSRKLIINGSRIMVRWFCSPEACGAGVKEDYRGIGFRLVCVRLDCVCVFVWIKLWTDYVS